MLPAIEVHDEVAGRVSLAVVEAAPVAIGPSSTGLRAEIERTTVELRERHAGRAPAAIAELQPARALYRSFGVDPTKIRPSSESLLRRVLREQPFPDVSNAVDLTNLLAVRFLLPLGLYDVGSIEGGIVLRRGHPDEHYAGIRKDRVSVGGRPVLADARGAFGNPTSDSLRTSVGPATRRLLLVVFAPGTVSGVGLDRLARQAADAIARHLAGPDRPVSTHEYVVAGAPGSEPG